MIAPSEPDSTVVLRGHITSERPDWIYVPFDVPRGTTRVEVSYSYDHANGNALDIGLFDARGTASGFRGWSGGARTSFTVSASDATPGYIPGPVWPGRWNVILGPYAVGAAGIDYVIAITLHSGPQGPVFVPHPARDSVPGRGRGWYRGDLHVHTIHSDGSFTPRDVVDGARTAELDFFVSTDHNTDAANAAWGLVTPPGLLAIRGEEVTTRAGHWGAVGLPPNTWIDWRYRPEDNLLSRFVSQVHAAGGVAVANHPFASGTACKWGFSYHPTDAIEVWNGPWDSTDERARDLWDAILRSGRRFPAVGGSDAHRPPDVIGRPQTVVHADGLSASEVVSALRAGHSYVAESKAVTLAFTACDGTRRAGIGDELPGHSADVELRVTGAPGTVVSFHTDRGPADGGAVTSSDDTIAVRVADARWARVEVRRADRTMVAFTNPIWLGRDVP